MNKRSQYVTVAFSENDYKKLREKADKERRPLAQFVWLVVVDYLEGQK